MKNREAASIDVEVCKQGDTLLTQFTLFDADEAAIAHVKLDRKDLRRMLRLLLNALTEIIEDGERNGQ
jgi:hypothetical protein